MGRFGAMRSISEYTHVQGSCPLANFVLLRSWIETSEGIDLTRSQLYGSSKNTTKVIPVNGKDRSIIIDTKRTLLCIIDMQSRSIYTVY
jgi:hypothetical protein